MDTNLGIHVGHDVVSAALAGAEGEVLAVAGPAPFAGAPLHALARLIDELLEPAGIEFDAVGKALATGIGSGFVADALGAGEVGLAAAAARAATVLAPGTRSALIVGIEEALLVGFTGVGAVDVRPSGPCGFGAGRLLARWAEGAPHAGVEAPDVRISASCAAMADEDLEWLSLEGAGPGPVAAAAVRAAAQILAGHLLQGRGIGEGSVALLGPGVGTWDVAERLAEELCGALELPDGSVIVPEQAQAAPAIGAALLAAASGRPLALPADRPPPAPEPVPSRAGAAKDADAVAGDAVAETRGAALASFAKRYSDAKGPLLALDIGARESVLVRLGDEGEPLDVEYPPPCGRGLGSALEDVARILGLGNAVELGGLAEGAERGTWLRDRCAGTIRRDAATVLASGADAREVARGALEAVGRAARRKLAGKWPPAKGALPERMLLTGPFARVPGLADAVARAFGVEAEVADGAPDAADVAAVGPVIDAAEPGPDGLAEIERLAREHIARDRLTVRIGRMGLPLSLMDGGRAVYWSRMLVELGFDVVFAERSAEPPPSAKGAGDPCSAAEDLRAEVAELVTLGVDAVFVPVEVDAPSETAAAGTGARDIVYRCPFLQAGAHLIPPKGVRVVRPVRFGVLPERLGLESLVDSLFPWRIAPGAVRLALENAATARKSYERALAASAEAFLEGLLEDSRAVVLLGREYGERLLPAEARAELTRGGVALVPQEFLLAKLTADDEDALAAAREMHWLSGRRILTAARKVARDGRFAALHITHARCGPDSFIAKYLREVLAGRPWTRIELSAPDAHRPSGPGRIVERCRAFRETFDARSRGDAKGEAPEFPEHPEPPRREGAPPLIRFPDMGTAADAGVAALEGFGIPGEVVRADEESLRAAARLTSGDECLPYIVTIGNLAKTVEAEGFDPAMSAFFMATSSGACRFGQYRRGFRQVLDALGHDDVRVISLNQSEGKTKQMPGMAFGILLWKGMMALGALDEVALHLRPRAADPDAAERALAESREDVLASLRVRKNPREALVRSAGRMRAIELDPGRLPVRIALTGEIFVRSQPFSNSGLVRVIEAAGGEVVAPPFQEWLHHVSRCIWLFARARGDAMAQLKVRLAKRFLLRGEERARSTLRRAGAPVPPEQPMIEEVWRASREAGFVPWFGDASLALGRAIALRRRGATGVVNIVPYGCLPGTVGQAVFAARRDAFGRMPVLHLSLDGGPAAEVRARVLDLVEAARNYSPPPPPPPKKRPRFIRTAIRRFWTQD